MANRIQSLKAAPKRATTKKSKAAAPPRDVNVVIAKLRRLGNKATLASMARYAIPSDKAFGVPVGTMRAYAKELGRDHQLAAALWQTSWYEARMLATFVDDPKLVTPAQMDSWCRDFDSWAICDTACFHLFDRTPHAFRKVEQWAEWRGEFQKRAAFALLASLALHDKKASDDQFANLLPLIEEAADDQRNFVKKGVSWALRGVGRRSRLLHELSLAMAKRLAESPVPSKRWIGKDAFKDLSRASVVQSLASRKAKPV